MRDPSPSACLFLAIGSLDLTSPECTVSMKYTQKWYLIMSVPINLAIIFFVAHCVLWFKKKLTRKKKKKKGKGPSALKHLPLMISFWLQALYYL